ncbi:MAG: glycosyltransferase family 9 protein [Gemmatimonadetes bacterium]|nr:glycosyltransferase family 9 protein [Gemmatimonadota bacterium]NNF12438.1 glycosyltransferase family 9 protein [Gemmatimonadota bacterium]
MIRPTEGGQPALTLGKPPREICIVMLSAIGDAVHVLPVANALKRQWPDSRITWVIQPVPHLMVKDHPAIDDFIVFRRRRGWSAWRGFQEIMESFRGRRFDLLLGLQVYFKAGLITALAPARVKLGFDRVRARDAQWLFTTDRIPSRGQRHVQDQYFEFLDHLGIDPEPVQWRMEFTEAERREQSAFFHELGRPACAVVVGTSKLEKNWHAEGYARVLEEVEAKHGLRPVIVGGPSEVERRIAAEVEKLTSATVVDALGDDLRKLMWIVDGSALLISPDTGPLHISHALGTPVVGLFGYTNPKRSGPYRAYRDLVVDGYAEYPGEEYPIMPDYRDGMKRIEVDDVLEKVDRAIEVYVGNDER